MTTEDRHLYYVEVINPRLDTLVRLICEATGIDDRVLEDSRYQDLRAFYEEQVSLGCWHPRLAEAMADFTAVREPASAIPLYQLAFEQACALDDDTQSILIAMAESLFELGRKEQAEAYLREGCAEALRREDYDCVREADRLLRELSG